MGTPNSTLFPDNVAAVVGNIAVPGTTTNFLFEHRESVIRALAAYGCFAAYRQTNTPSSPQPWDFWIVPGLISGNTLVPADIKVYDGTQWQNITPTLFGRAIMNKAAGGAWKDATCGLIAAPANKTYTIVLKAPYAGVIKMFSVQTASGSCTVDLVIAGSSVQQLAASVAYATAAPEVPVAANDKIALTVSASSSPVDLAFEFQIQRT